MKVRRIKIGDKYGTRHVVVNIGEEEDAITLMKILAKNGVPATLYISEKESD